MFVGEKWASAIFIDYLGNSSSERITIAEDGWADFHVSAKSVERMGAN